MENALHVLGAWLLCGAVWIALGAWMVHRLWKRWHEMTLLAKLTALLLAAPVAFAVLSTLLGLPTVLDAISGDPSKSAALSMAGYDGAAMGIAFGFVFCLFNPIFSAEVSKNPETRRRRPRGELTHGSPPPRQ